MIADILLSWNELTVTIVAWLGVVSLALAADFGPEIYREKKAREQLMRSVAMVAAQRAHRPKLDPGKTMDLGVFVIQPQPTARRRHAKVAA